MGVNGGGITGGLCTASASPGAGEQLLIQLSPIFKGCYPGLSTALDSYSRIDGDTVFTRPFHGKKYRLQHNNSQIPAKSFQLWWDEFLTAIRLLGIELG